MRWESSNWLGFVAYIYAVDIPGYYKPVLIKKSDSDEIKCYRVYEEWLLAFCPLYRNLL